MDQTALKRLVAQKATQFIQPGTVLGIGTGSTVNYFIEALWPFRNKIDAVVASSLETAEKVKALSIPVVDLNEVSELSLYIDSADQANKDKQLLKGGGGALTREKIVAAVAKQFVCIIDVTKYVATLDVPVVLEVIPMARSYIARQLVKMGANPVYRRGVITDNGNQLLDVYDLGVFSPTLLEQQLNNIPGVVANGIFASRPADKLLVATEHEIVEI